MYHIIGHKNPDTDAILSALVAREYFLAIGQDAEAYRLGELNRETVFVLAALGIEAPQMVSSFPAGTEIVMVDHNVRTQSIDGLETLKVRSIIDHHAVENLSTSEPIQLRFEPLCSTCSLLFNMFAEQDLEMSDVVARMILAGILSDSLAFRSPTTTEEDREIAAFLAEDLGITDIQTFAKEMFDAKSDLSDMPVRQLVQLDYKVFTAGTKKFGYGVMETTNPAYAMSRKDEILADMQKLKTENGMDALFFSVIDILAEKNMTFVLGDTEKDIIRSAFHAETSDSLADLGRRLSRKKELEPQVRAFLEKL